ncbi:MAG TPA: 3-oxoacyl-[acyl-carrier-protein] synthase III C-terminal domain-containing protein [Acidimicrobiia bacterium]|nr:3-oxoacyl-[acyl-carrier-protein] synthase III C-terminal domain-containing protein [Acidimicrobiia bacterium]
MSAVISGTGVARPPNVVTNDHLARIMDTSDEWIRSRSGVAQRHFVEPGTGSSDLAVEAIQAALDDAGVDGSSVDVLVTATMTPDVMNPGIAGLVQHKLGLGRIPAFDLRQQCSGFLYALDLADSLIGSDRADTVVVAGAEVHAGYLPWGHAWEIALGRSDRRATRAERERATAHRGWSVLFGDGAGAMVLQRSAVAGVGVLGSILRTDGSQFELIVGGDFGFVHRPYISEAMLAQELHLPRMDGGGLYRHAVRLMPEAILEVLDKTGYSLDDLDVVVAHQANERILAGVRRQLGVDETLVPSNIAEWANTTAATLPILFHELRAAGRIMPQTLVCFTAFGAGAHWGAVLYRQP